MRDHPWYEIPTLVLACVRGPYWHVTYWANGDVECALQNTDRTTEASFDAIIVQETA